MASSQLPTSRTFITSLINSLATQATTTNQVDHTPPHNSLKNASSQTKSLLLTLHILFPNELLPALDVLDRNLVTRLSIESPSLKDTEVYLVRSAQQPSSYHRRDERFSNPMNACYEVRTKAWNCSCPAFAFSEFPGEDVAEDAITMPPNLPALRPTKAGDKMEWSFGGLSIEGLAPVPVCKHLLACVLGERCPGLFGNGLEDKQLSREEYAGWCAGWGG